MVNTHSIISIEEKQQPSHMEQKLIATVTDYQNQRSKYLEEPFDSSLAISVTENFRQTFSLQQERLRKYDLQMEIQEQDIGYLPFMGENYCVSKAGYVPDGRHVIGCLQKWIRYTVKYRRKQGEAASFSDIFKAHYYTKEEPGEVGTVSSVDLLFEEDFCDRGTEYLDSKKFGRKKADMGVWAVLEFFMWVTCSIGGIVLFYSMFVDIHAILAGVSIVTCLVFGKSAWKLSRHNDRLRKSYRLRECSRQVVEALRKDITDFSVEKFIAMADNKIHGILYAENRQWLEVFTDCDAGNLLKTYETVINTSRRDFWFERYRTDNEYYYVDVVQSMNLTRYEDDGIIREQQDIRMSLKRPMAGIMADDFYQDWFVTDVKTYKESYEPEEVYLERDEGDSHL